MCSASEGIKFDDGTDFSEECIPVKAGVLKSLDAEETYELLVHASSEYKEQISTVPPVQPKEDSDKWDLQVAMHAWHVHKYSYMASLCED